jgi:prevent-host-death family protein
MSPHDEELKTDVGIRELRDNLSRYVDHVVDGNEVNITSRGKIVARIIPAAPNAPFAELRRQGMLSEPTKPKGPFQPEPGPPLSKKPVAGEFLNRWR